MTDTIDFKTFVKKTGNKFTVLIPENVAARLNLKDNDEVRIIIRNEQAAGIDEELRQTIDQYLYPNAWRKGELGRAMSGLIRNNPQAQAYMIMSAVNHIRFSDNWGAVNMVMALLFDAYQVWGSNRLHSINELKHVLAEKVVQLGLPKTIYDKDFHHVNYSLGIVGVETRLQESGIAGSIFCDKLSDAEFEEEKERILRVLL